ncbi:uncharacterized protein LOC126742997 isoform X2 [Anthonomus grandis grandis]|uniref:uncharacterized protein LOC126742997 isoform X2 n=1 Tax=Anthonomus grandis grandis TaxID=2921223 RepID=UPI002166343B|nr:uncharacterized protein LOC126742997 isoform X2 [Anthonomus grandis grandis]
MAVGNLLRKKMSEILNNSEKHQDVDGNEKSSLEVQLRKKWQLCAKTVELIFCVLCLALIMEPAKRGYLAQLHLDHFSIIFPTFIGYMTVVSIFLSAKLLQDKIPYKTGFLFSAVASWSFFASGVLLTLDRKEQYFYDERFFKPPDYVLYMLQSCIGFSYLSAIVFGVEAWFIWKFKEDF